MQVSVDRLHLLPAVCLRMTDLLAREYGDEVEAEAEEAS